MTYLIGFRDEDSVEIPLLKKSGVAFLGKP